MQINQILVPLDFSEFSEKALLYGLELAERCGSRLTLLHAVVLFQDDIGEEQKLQEYEEWVKRREQRIHSQINQGKKQATDRGIDVDTVILRGVSAADVILEYLDDHPSDLVIMGTHGRSGLKHILHGSVAEKVMKLSPYPVITVHRSVKSFKMENLLVPIDFSVYSKAAADYAIFLAKTFKAGIDFLHVIDHEIHPSFYAAGVDSIFEIDKELKNRVIKNMKGFLADQLNKDIRIHFLVREGRAHKEIVEFSKENESDMIVIATHGLTALDYILLGSTTEKVVRWANCPVLTVKRNP